MKPKTRFYILVTKQMAILIADQIRKQTSYPDFQLKWPNNKDKMFLQMDTNGKLKLLTKIEITPENIAVDETETNKFISSISVFYPKKKRCITEYAWSDLINFIYDDNFKKNLNKSRKNELNEIKLLVEKYVKEKENAK